MRKCLLILATCSASAVAGEQYAPLVTLEPANSITREQRRTELRTVLQSHRQREPTAIAADVMPVERHLTEQERAEIRLQLRQNRPERHKSSP